MENFPINPKTSSQLKWARYEPVTARVQIDFKNNAGEYQSTYEYGSPKMPFTRQDWESFRAAARPGEYFAHSIRNKFPYKKIGQTKETTEPQQQGLF